MFSEELKRGTATVHAELEKKLIPHIRKVNGRKAYATLLRLMYGFYSPLQHRLEPYLDQLEFAGHHRGRQAENILQDLRALEQESSPIGICRSVPEINSYAEALGALYVTEGSTLGGQIIIGMITRQIGEDISGADLFFNSYGQDTRKLWENFRDLLNQPLTTHDQQQVMQSALQTFTSFKQWISDYESGPDQ